MLEIKQHTKDLDFSAYDYVFEDVKSFEDVLPFLLPKLEGDWKVMLIEPKLTAIRAYLDTSIVPSYVALTITVDADQLSQLYLERPQLVKKEKTNWDKYLDLLKEFPVPMDDRSMRELYYRQGPKEENLKKALVILESYSVVTMREINRHFAPVNRVFANQVMRAFLLGRSKQAWRMLNLLEQEIGSTVAFYALRKSIRRVFADKCKYLKNEETKEIVPKSI